MANTKTENSTQENQIETSTLDPGGDEFARNLENRIQDPSSEKEKEKLQAIKCISEERERYEIDLNEGQSNVEEQDLSLTQLAKLEDDFSVQIRSSDKYEDTFIALEKWEGYVEKVTEDDTFHARLIRLTDADKEEYAEFPLEEVSDNDQALVEEGAVFYWYIGFEYSKHGQKKNTSILHFRRTPAQNGRVSAPNEELEKLEENLEWN